MKRQKLAPDRIGAIPMPSGLKPVFPEGAHCIEISSPFGSPTRYDGSMRPKNRYGGHHGGVDLSLDEGTPLIAIADGVLIRKGEGDQMEGNYIWTRHSPEDTGLSYWVFAKYQHLVSVPEIEEGERIIIGQVIAYSGKTGTQGGHYGADGYPHLHISILKSSNGDINPKNIQGSSAESSLIDLLVLFKDSNLKSNNTTDTSSEGTVTIPIMSIDNRFFPQGTRVVWPVACEMK